MLDDIGLSFRDRRIDYYKGILNNPKMPNKLRYGIYRMPAEWERQKSTWIAWPHNKADWPGKFNQIPWVFAEIITTLSKFQSVNILVKNKSEKKKQLFF